MMNDGMEQNEGSANQMTFEQFVQLHQGQLTSCLIPERHWHALFDKLKDEVYDAGEKFQMQLVVQQGDGGSGSGTNDYEWRVAVNAEDGVPASDADSIFLIDHAWTYRFPEARPSLEQVPGLLERMAKLMNIKDKSNSELIEEVLEAMWRFNQTYSFGHLNFGSDESMPFWYVMDEFGSRIQHSDDPNVRIAPFFFMGSNLAFSVMWLMRDLDNEEEVTRNYVVASRDPDTRKAQLIPWVDRDMTEYSFKQEEPDTSHFMEGKMPESLPSPSFEYPGLPKDRNLKVYTEYQTFYNFLTDGRFELVDDPDEADILWLLNHYHDYLNLSKERPHCLVNQFPYEACLTTKDNLAIVSRRSAKPDGDPMQANPRWQPVTFNLQTELPQFVSYFQNREKRGLDNHWICKPWNLARSLDMHITNKLDHVIRQRESGPKVVSKYIHDPVLFNREDVGWVKFDYRYIVLVSSVEPLKMYAYEVFWLRFANSPFSLERLDDYHKHFTVMNYVDEGKKLKQVHYDDFIPMFEEQYPGFNWADIENDTFNLIRELFQGATSLPPPAGIGHSTQSRATYALDLMLQWETLPSGEKRMQPMVCEVNFQADCDRACKYHPFFANDIFSVLFLDDTEDKHIIPL